MAHQGSAIVHQGIVEENPPYAFSHTSTLVESAPGITLAAWVGGPGNRMVGNSIYLASRENDKWAAPVKVAWAEEVPCFNPVLFTDANSGQILLFYKRGSSPETWSAALLRSNDAGKTWTEPEYLPAGMTGCVRSKPLQLDDGTLICGDSVEAYQAWSCWVNVTKDLAKTWTRHGPITLPNTPFGIIQPTIFWADADRTTLRMLVRGSSEVGRVCTATSTDEGRTWTPAKAMEGLPNPNSAVDAVRLRDGRILLAHNDDAESKSRLVISVSRDGGETWRRAAKVMTPAEGEYIYPAIVEDSRGMVQMTYTWRKTRIGYVIINPGKM